MIRCLFCGEHVEQFDITAGGADSQGSKGAAGTFDHPALVECECSAAYADGDLVRFPAGKEITLKGIPDYLVMTALSKLVEHVDDT